MNARLRSRFERGHASKPWKRGQTLVEYALIMVVLSIVAVAVYGLLDTQIANIFVKIDNVIDTAQSSH
jgi:Flp pilus assembly pilin Flp